MRWGVSRQLQPGTLVGFARYQADQRRANGGPKRVVYRGSVPYVPIDLTDQQLHEVERLLKVRGLKRKHIALMCACSSRLINLYFPPAEFPYLPLPP